MCLYNCSACSVQTCLHCVAKVYWGAKWAEISCSLKVYLIINSTIMQNSKKKILLCVLSNGGKCNSFWKRCWSELQNLQVDSQSGGKHCTRVDPELIQVIYEMTGNDSSRIHWTNVTLPLKRHRKWISYNLTFVTLFALMIELKFILKRLVCQHGAETQLYLWNAGSFLLCFSALFCLDIITSKWWLNPCWLCQNVLRWVWSHWRSKTPSWERHHTSAEAWALTAADSTSR